MPASKQCIAWSGYLLLVSTPWTLEIIIEFLNGTWNHSWNCPPHKLPLNIFKYNLSKITYFIVDGHFPAWVTRTDSNDPGLQIFGSRLSIDYPLVVIHGNDKSTIYVCIYIYSYIWFPIKTSVYRLQESNTILVNHQNERLAMRDGDPRDHILRCTPAGGKGSSCHLQDVAYFLKHLEHAVYIILIYDIYLSPTTIYISLSLPNLFKPHILQRKHQQKVPTCNSEKSRWLSSSGPKTRENSYSWARHRAKPEPWRSMVLNPILSCKWAGTCIYI
jgi:hypothetical protein